MKEKELEISQLTITIELSKQYDIKKEQNEKLSFLNNPITRPFALVEEPVQNNQINATVVCIKMRQFCIKNETCRLLFFKAFNIDYISK